jgi:uncharacterized protein
MPLTLSHLPGEYAVAQLPEDAEPPTWAFQSPVFSLTRAPGELSVVCQAALVPPEVRAERGWAVLMLHGPFDFGLTGILAAVLNPLSGAGIGIFAFSTFDTDYLLVKVAQLGAAVDALRAAGHSVLD